MDLNWSTLSTTVRLSRFFYIYYRNEELFLNRLDPVDKKLYVKYQVIGPNQVAVPTHFFKVMIGQQKDGQLDILSYMMPNAPIDNATPLEEFLVPTELIEQNAGFLITSGKLPKEKIRSINKPSIEFKLRPPSQQNSLSPPPSRSPSPELK